MDIRLEDNVNLAPGEVVTSVPAKSPQSNTSVFWHLSVRGAISWTSILFSSMLWYTAKTEQHSQQHNIYCDSIDVWYKTNVSLVCLLVLRRYERDSHEKFRCAALKLIRRKSVVENFSNNRNG